MFTYEDLIEFVEKNDYQKKPFNKVIELYKQEMTEYYDSMDEDTYISSEVHEMSQYY